MLNQWGCERDHCWACGRHAEQEHPDWCREVARQEEAERRALKRRRGNALQQLMRGERVYDKSSHHKAMAKLKALMGDPRPEGMELSLVNPDSPYAYWGRNGKSWYRLSTDPADYVWETAAENKARGRPVKDAAEYLELFVMEGGKQ